jgi:1-acyl-sn-glycerol-3-phosphate acyltransferase
MHGYIYIILKESLKNVPIVGWGAQFYNFIFLSRKWEQDKEQFQSHLDQLNTSDPMWLLIFPEGTNLAKETREQSKAWADKNRLQDMKHQLLPRSKGLQFSLQRLRKTTEWLYDCTIGYEGIPQGQFGQDIFTLRSCMFEGRPPKSVNMHFRRFKISTIPIDNDKAFEVWLRNRWREKDYLLEHFVQFKRFPDDERWMITQRGTGTNPSSCPAKFIETEIKSNNMEEFLSIFAPLTSVSMLLSLAYGGTNPKDLMQMLTASGKNGSNQLKLLQGGLTSDNLQKLQCQIPSGAGTSTGFGLNEGAQKDFIQKYLNSIKPAVSKQIALQDHQLQPVQSRALSTKPASRSAQTLSSRGSTTSRVYPNSVVRSSLPTKPKDQPLHRTLGNPPLKKATTQASASRVQSDRKATVSEEPSSKPSSQNTTKRSDNKTSSQSVTIDPKILARMKGQKALQGKKVPVNPSIRGKEKVKCDEKAIPVSSNSR